MDDMTFLTGLFRSLALSALIILAFSKVIRLTPGGRATSIAVGTLFAGAGFLSMSDPIAFSPGIFYDGRVPILALAYTFSGFTGTLITVLVIGAYRLWLGGAGAVTGIAGILMAAAAGVFVGRLPNRLFKGRLSKPLVLGMTASASMVSILALPQAARATISLDILLPILAANIIGVVILHDFLANEKRSLRLFKTLEHDAAIDPLTRLSNRRAFDARAAGALSPEHNPGGSYSVIMIDIDHFKAVNDTYGHDAGDSVLATVAAIINDCVRKTDIVARFGGEEIAVLLPGLDKRDAATVAEKIRKKVETQQFAAANTNMRITVSLGAAAANMRSVNVTSALKAADIALYAAKRAGRNRVETALVA